MCRCPALLSDLPLESDAATFVIYSCLTTFIYIKKPKMLAVLGFVGPAATFFAACVGAAGCRVLRWGSLDCPSTALLYFKPLYCYIFMLVNPTL